MRLALLMLIWAVVLEATDRHRPLGSAGFDCAGVAEQVAGPQLVADQQGVEIVGLIPAAGGDQCVGIVADR
jgi:hypothetical protein